MNNGRDHRRERRGVADYTQIAGSRRISGNCIYAEGNDKMHNAPAELHRQSGREGKGFGIKLTARTDGVFTIQN